MTNAEIWGQYKDYTRDLTEFSRKLAFAAAAIAWALKTDTGFSGSGLLALASVVIFFMADVFQSLTAALCLRRWLYAEEEKRWMETKSIEGDYQKPKSLDKPAFFFFGVKIAALMLSFAFIGAEIVAKWGA